MKLTVKDLAGKKTEVEVDPSIKVSDLKVKLQELDANMEVSRQRLIFKGKVLKDEDTIESTGVTENDFFVCMVNKPKAAPKAPAPAPAPAPATTTTAAAPAPAPSTAGAPAPAPAPATPAPAPAVDPAQVQSLVEFGFPEANVRAALAATNGNPDMAYALLESGMPIPAPPTSAPATSSAAPGSAPTPGSITTLEGFRSHPQFNDLKRVVQQNPGALDQVLSLIGQQSPELFQVIMQHQDEFIAMMNEPITETAPRAAPTGSIPGAPPTGGAPLGGLPGLGGLGGLEGLDGGGPSPQQLAAMLQAMPEQQRNQLLGALMGVPPDQASQFSQQLIQALASGAAPGGLGGMGGPPPGAQRIQLTEEEAANLNQLVAMGFDRTEALQVFLACDKNVEMAASMLFDNMAAEGGPQGSRGSGGTGGDQGSSGDGSDDQMY